MCGIAGELRFDGAFADVRAVAAMTEAQARRGPDSEGVFGLGPRCFGHRRLAIMDLTHRAHQPFVDNGLGLGIVFNGAIYNHHALRAELTGRGYAFTSTGDTEVIVKAWHAWGPQALERLQGMFAFALWERDSGTTYLARDRLGIKPLYYTLDRAHLRFASALPALLAAGGVDTALDPTALHHYLSFHAVVPAPLTLLRGVRKLPPGHWMAVHPNGRCDLERWWRLGFERSDEEAGDEFRYSDLVARHYGTVHEKLFVPAGSLLQSLPDAIAAMSEPMVSHDCVAFYLLSQAVSRHSRVVQSGQGADEVFGGYHWYPPLAALDDPDRSVEAYCRVFLDRDQAGMEALLQPGRAADDASRRFVSAHFAQPGAASAIDRALRLDTTVMLVEDPVKRVDNMTMAFGLEARVPFLDHELVELAARIPARHKVAAGGKHVLKEAARAVIPAEVIDRPKGYFPVPALKYLRGEFLDYVRATLDHPAARTRGLFRREAIDRMLQEPDRHLTPLRGSSLWQVALLEAWLQTHRL